MVGSGISGCRCRLNYGIFTLEGSMNYLFSSTLSRLLLMARMYQCAFSNLLAAPYGDVPSRSREARTPERRLCGRRLLTVSCFADRQGSKTVQAQGRSRVFFFAHRLVDLTWKSKFEAT